MVDDLLAMLRRPYGNPTFAEKQEIATRIEELEAAYQAARDETYRMAVTATEAETRAETYRAAIPVAYQMALDAGAGCLENGADGRFDPAAAIERSCARTIRALTPPADLVEQVTAKVKGGE